MILLIIIYIEQVKKLHIIHAARDTRSSLIIFVAVLNSWHTLAFYPLVSSLANFFNNKTKNAKK